MSDAWLMGDASRLAATWPPYLTTRRALVYTGRSRATINRAVAGGKLPVYGRPGGGERIFRREDIDRWLGTAPDLAHDTSPRRAERTPRSGRTDALARIAATARGGAK